MSIRLDKPWIEFSKQSIDRLTGHLGVYQLGNAEKEIIYIGVAGARSRFGLRGELVKWLELNDTAISFFRLEVTMAYKTRHTELLQIFLKGKNDEGGRRLQFSNEKQEKLVGHKRRCFPR